VFATNLTGRYNLWKVSSDGGWPIQISQSDERQSGATWSPDGKWITFEADRGGDEMYDVYAISIDGGAIYEADSPLAYIKNTKGRLKYYAFDVERSVNDLPAALSGWVLLETYPGVKPRA
jgi:hypothetical protein